MSVIENNILGGYGSIEGKDMTTSKHCRLIILLCVYRRSTIIDHKKQIEACINHKAAQSALRREDRTKER